MADSAETLALRVMLEDLASAGIRNMNSSLHTLESTVSQLGGVAQGTGTRLQGLGTNASAASGHVRSLGTSSQTANRNVREFGASAAAARGHTTALGSASQAAALAIREQGVATRQSTTATRLATQAVRSLGRGSREAAAGVRAHGTASRAASASVRAMGTEARKTVADLRAMGTSARSSATDLERAAQKMIASLGAITAASDLAAANMARTFSRSSMNAARSGGRNAGSAWSDGFAGSIRANQSKLLAPLKGAGSVLGLAGTFGAAALAKAGVDRLSTIENAEMAFATSLGTKRMASDFSAELLTFARTTPFPFTDIANQARNMLAFGLPKQDIIPTLTAVGNAAGGSGSGTPGMNAIGTAIGKIMSQGQVYADDINSLAVNGVPARTILANQAGVDGPGLRKMMMRGEIDGKTAVDWLVSGIMEGSSGGMGKTAPLAGLMENMKETWSGGLSDFRATVTSSMAKIMEPAMPGLRAGVDKVGQIFKALPSKVADFTSYAAAPVGVLVDSLGLVVGAAKGILSVFGDLPSPIRAALMGIAAYMLIAARGTGRMITGLQRTWQVAGYGYGALARVRAGLEGTTSRARMFGQAFTASGIAYTRALAGIGASGTTLTRTQAIVAGVQRSFSGLGTTVVNGAKRMGSSLMGALGGPWGLAIAAGVAGLSMWINKQGQAAAAERAHAEALAALQAQMNQVTGEQTPGSIKATSDAWSKRDQGEFADQSQFQVLEGMGLDSQKLFEGVTMGGKELAAARAEINRVTQARLESTSAWKEYGEAAKAAGYDAETVVYLTNTSQWGLLDGLRKGISDAGGDGARGLADLTNQAKASIEYTRGAAELLEKSHNDVVKAGASARLAFEAASGVAAKQAGISSDKLIPALQATENKAKSVNDVMNGLGIEPGKQELFIAAMSDHLIKAGDDAYYLDAAAAEAAGSVDAVSQAMTDLGDEAEAIGDRNFFRDWADSARESVDEVAEFADSNRKKMLEGWSTRAESPYIQMLAEIGDAADDAAGRVDAFRATLDKALGIDRASEQVDADYFAGLQSLKEGFKTITEDSGGMIENYMGKKGDWNVQGVTSEGKMPGIEGRKNDEAFMKLLDARILDAYDKAMATGAGEGAARAAAVAAGNQGKQDYLSAAATQYVDPGLANAAFNRNYGGETVDQKVNLILEEASVARFEAGIGAAISSAGEDYSSQMSAAVEYVADYAQSHGMEIPADLDTLPALSAYNGLRAKVETELQMRINAMAQLTIQYNYANRATGVRGLEKESANGNIFGFADGGERHSMMVAGGANGRGILWGEPETGWESYISGKPSQRTRNIGLMKQTASRLGGRFIANNETNAASAGGVIAPAATTGSGSGGGLGGGVMTIAANAVQVRIDGGTHSGEQIGAIVTEAVAKAMYEVQRENESRKF